MVEIGGAEGMEKSEGRSSVRDSGNGAEVEWLFLWYRRMRRRWWGVAKAEKVAYSGGVGGVAKVKKVAYSGGVCGYGSLRGIGRYRECGGVGVLPRLKSLRTASELAGTEVYAALAARSWQTGR